MSDPRLQSLIQMVTKRRTDGKPMDVPISIFVGGSLIRGTLITQEEYYRFCGGMIEEFGNAAEEGELAGIIQGNASLVDLNDLFPECVHIHATIIYCGGGNILPPETRLPWRGLLERVDGYFFGKMIPR